jgi:hypothetical protein
LEAKRELPCGGDAVEVEFEDVDAWLTEEAELTALSVLSDELADGADDRGIAVTPVVSVAGEDTRFAALHQHLGQWRSGGSATQGK